MAGRSLSRRQLTPQQPAHSSVPFTRTQCAPLSQRSCHTICELLITLDANLDLKPGLAEFWQQPAWGKDPPSTVKPGPGAHVPCRSFCEAASSLVELALPVQESGPRGKDP